MKPESITLYYQEGSSDKVYTVNLRNVTGDWWDVACNYGRRGDPQKTILKTEKAVSYDKAKTIYDKVVHTQQLKGYTASGDALAYADNPNAGEDTGFRPQLLNEVTEEEAEAFYFEFPRDIALQVKWDGERRAVIAQKGEDPIYTNRKGQAKGVLGDIDKAVRLLINNRSNSIKRMELDTEDMGDHLVIFDMIGLNDIDMKKTSFKQRADTLEILQGIISWEGLSDTLRVHLPTYPKSIHEFRWFINHCRAHNEEGVVIRRASAIYEPGRPNSGGNCLKLKFVGEATCQIIGHVEGKASVELAVISDDGDDGDGFLTPIGKVTIPPNYDMPKIGDLVEIRYMNIMRGDGAKLFQPRYKGVRTDKTKADLYSSLKFKKDD